MQFTLALIAAAAAATAAAKPDLAAEPFPSLKSVGDTVYTTLQGLTSNKTTALFEDKNATAAVKGARGSVCL